MRARYGDTRWVFLTLLLICTQGSLWGLNLSSIQKFEPTITDGRAIALGHSSLLGTQNANNVFNNPSALANLRSRSVMLSMRVRSGESDRDDNAQYGDSYTYTYKLHPKLNGVAFATPFKACSNKNMRLGLGFGYRPYYDWGYYADYEWRDTYSGDVEKAEMEMHGGFDLMSIAFGATYKNLFNFGLSVNFPFLSEASREYGYPGMSSSEKVKDEIRTAGTFFVFSGSYNLTPTLLLSARLRTGFLLSYDMREDNPYIDRAYWQYNDRDYTIPSELTVAARFAPMADLSLYAEVVSRFYDAYKELRRGNYGATEKDLYDGADPGISLRLGMEYGTKLQYRLGCYWQSVPVFNHNDEGDITDGSSQLGFTGGIGVPFAQKWQLDAYADYATHSIELHELEETADITNTSFQFGCSLGYNY